MSTTPSTSSPPSILPVSVRIERGRRRRSWGATVAVLAVTAGPLGYLAWRAAAVLGLSSEGPAVLDLAAAPLLLLSALVLGRVVRQRRTPRRVRLLPQSVQRAVGDLVELSAFGTGALRGWSIALPATDLRRLVQPEPLPDSEPDIPGDGGASPRPRHRPPPAHRRRAPLATPAAATPGPTRTHTVARGETWWTLAADTLGDGRHWRALVELNIGRQVGPGMTIGADTALRRGWEIELPAATDEGTEP